MFQKRLLFVILGALLIGIGAFAETIQFVVDPAGHDDSPGTADKPFASIARAQQALRAISSQMDEDWVVLVRGGVYRLSSPLLFSPEDSGRNGHSIIYRAAPGESPVLSGGLPITGWRPTESGQWTTTVSSTEFRQLYVNGVRATRARGDCPETAEFFGSLDYIDADAGQLFPDGSMADWKNQSDIELGYYNSWGHMICKVNRITLDREGRALFHMKQPQFFLAKRKEGVRAEQPAYIENALELLDEPGEWYYDRAAKTLHYIPREGEDMATAEVVVPSLETLMRLDGTLDNPVRNLTFEGITFADATWLQPNRIGHIDLQANFTIAETDLFPRDGFIAGMHNEYRKSPAHIMLHTAIGCAFERCVFTRLGGTGLDLETGAQNNLVQGCRFFDISGSAIQIGDILTADHHPTDPRLIVAGNQILNNYIYRTGVEYQDSVGVFGGYTKRTRIAHNEICELPYSGISLGWGWGEEDAGGGAYETIPFRYEQPTPAAENHIEDNHIHHVMLRRDDGGGIYTLGNQPGSTIRGNHVHDNGPGVPGGIYLDEGSGYFEITGNAVYNVATAMNYNNRAQDRIATCNEHDNAFDIQPSDSLFPTSIQESAGLESAYRDLLGK